MSESKAAIIRGSESTEEEDYVVEVLRKPSGFFCTGTLIAPNVVLTALHCVTEFSPAGFRCDRDGNLIQTAEGAGEFGPRSDPQNIEIRLGTTAWMNSPVAHATKIFDSGSRQICENDIAVLVIDTELSQPAQQVRIGQPTSRGELLTLIGYGQDEMNVGRTRHRRTGVRIIAVGPADPYPKDGNAAPRTFATGEGACQGDSGGPALSEETGAIVGVYSVLDGECTAPGVRNVYTQVAPFERLLRQAAEFAGAGLLVEPIPQTGEGGDGGTSALEPNAGGGVGNTPNDTGGSLGNGASAAVDPGEMVGGRVIGKGSGSREDPACTCRMEGLAAKPPSAWLGGLLAIATTTFLRRRRRL